MDKARFEQLWLRCANDGEAAGGAVSTLFNEVAGHYTEGHRRYHTPEHIEHCLVQFDAARTGMRWPDAVELAVWYHDVIYDSGAHDNELRSAQLFERRARDRIPDKLIDKVQGMIMATAHAAKTPETRDQAYLVDIDLSSFGLPWEKFIEDSIAVREEFPQMPDDEFYCKQGEFLRSLLAREHFCFTRFFRERHEARARDNISRYLKTLERRGLVDSVAAK